MDEFKLVLDEEVTAPLDDSNYQRDVCNKPD